MGEVIDYYSALDKAIEDKGPVPEYRVRRSNNETQRLITRISIATEVGRLIVEDKLTGDQRSLYLWTLIQALDFSDDWLRKKTDRSIGDLYDEIKLGLWRDVDLPRNPERLDLGGSTSGYDDHLESSDGGAVALDEDE